MILAHTPGGGHGTGLFGAVLVLGAALSAAGYLAAAARLRRRGDGWPRHRDALFAAGCAALAGAAAGTPPGGPFTVHMIRHLVFAMAVPPVLAAARPVTLVLRTLPAGPPRRALRAVLGSRPAALLLFPPMAAALDVGGLWLLYRTPLLSRSAGRPLLDAAVHLHVLVSGLLLAFAVCSLEPVRHRWSLAWRGGALLAAGTAHAVLARTLYATPPPGTAFATADLRRGAQWMYYGGDLAELALASLLAADWYARTGRARRRAARRETAFPGASTPREGVRTGRVAGRRVVPGCSALFRLLASHDQQRIPAPGRREDEPGTARCQGPRSGSGGHGPDRTVHRGRPAARTGAAGGPGAAPGAGP
ncbi:cytochrome c oxidase assembly protein [Streptomyces griseoaurantiacus]|uniref:cytochrome c oxidase assembly protein n=1 Tax=Streptomyces griseoaurantiacus TaxID=68213 RepID=UPI0036CF86D8